MRCRTEDTAGEMQTHISMEQQMNCQTVIQVGDISRVDGAEGLRWPGLLGLQVPSYQLARWQVFVDITTAS